jgi:hypothetical protein
MSNVQFSAENGAGVNNSGLSRRAGMVRLSRSRAFRSVLTTLLVAGTILVTSGGAQAAVRLPYGFANGWRVRTGRLEWMRWL